jgi:post-segregation antitoxin (ccd killing protein)
MVNARQNASSRRVYKFAKKKKTPGRLAAIWLKKNRSALEAYNKHIQVDGVFSAGLRLF